MEERQVKTEWEESKRGRKTTQDEQIKSVGYRVQVRIESGVG